MNELFQNKNHKAKKLERKKLPYMIPLLQFRYIVKSSLSHTIDASKHTTLTYSRFIETKNKLSE